MRFFPKTLVILLPLAVVLAGLALVLGSLTPSSSGDSAEAAVASDFNAGYIISDANFYDSNAMTASDIQTFLNAQLPVCDTNHAGTVTYGGVVYSGPWTCLKDYRTSISGNPATAYCSAISGGTFSAAEVIDTVSRSCGISQKVLLVLLQKEQALVTDTWPGPWQYQKATGYACPDTAACDSTYYGFFNQVYMAAWQFKQYQASASTRAYRAGAWNTILYSPNTACGTASVYIQNQATAALYIYTPYVPNAAALSNLYGSGDGCSAYGNRNFWRMYSDWFGSPTGYTVHGAIGDLYNANGGYSWIGAATGAEITGLTGSGASQTFQGGTIFWSASTGAYLVRAEILTTYANLGWEEGKLGYPVGAEVTRSSGARSQSFQNGAIDWTASSGAHATVGAIRQLWQQTGWEKGVLGYPTAEELTGLALGGASQSFQGGTALWSSDTGAYYVKGAIRDKYRSVGWENSSIGYPVTNEHTGQVRGGAWQDFRNATILWSPATGANIVQGAIRSAWASQDYQSGWLGYPTSDEISDPLRSGEVFQNFEGGQVHWVSSTDQIYFVQW